jgi:hypothetical protein
MERRRLKLHSAVVDLTAAPDPERRVAGLGRCVALADAENGSLAVAFGLALLEELRAQGHAVPVVFAAFREQPELEPAALARARELASSVRLCALSGAGADLESFRDAQIEIAQQQPVWLLIGAPALLAFDAPLSVLLTGQRPFSAWPDALRSVRPGVSLELVGVRPLVARWLARSLAPTAAP